MFLPRRVLAAVDFSECSRIALNAAVRLASHCDAALQVIHVEDPLLAQAAQIAGRDLRAETTEELRRFIPTAATARIEPELLVFAGRAADIICQIAQRESADVIVIGAQGMTAVERALFGSTAERVVRLTRRPVLVIPSSWASVDRLAPDLAGIGPIVAGVESTTGAAMAAAAAADLAFVLHTSLELIHVVPPIVTPQRWATHAEEAMSAARQCAEQDLTCLVRGLRHDLPVRTLVQAGPIASTLADAARTSPSRHPIVVLGRNREGSASGEPGAIALRVLMKAPAPVLVYLTTD